MSGHFHDGLWVLVALGGLMCLCVCRTLCSPSYWCSRRVARKLCPWLVERVNRRRRRRQHRRLADSSDSGGDDPEFDGVGAGAGMRSHAPDVEEGLRVVEQREAAARRNVGRLREAMRRELAELEKHSTMREALTARLGTARTTPASGGDPLTARSAAHAAALEKYHARGRALYGDAWDAPPPDGGLPLSQVFSMPDEEVAELQAAARAMLHKREQSRRAEDAHRAPQFATPRQAAAPGAGSSSRRARLSARTPRTGRTSRHTSTAAATDGSAWGSSRAAAGAPPPTPARSAGTGAAPLPPLPPHPPRGPPPAVPRLDFSRLPRAPA